MATATLPRPRNSIDPRLAIAAARLINFDTLRGVDQFYRKVAALAMLYASVVGINVARRPYCQSALH